MSITSSSNHTLWTPLFQTKGIASIFHDILDVIPLVEFLQCRFTFPVCCPDGLADYASLFHEWKNKHNFLHRPQHTKTMQESDLLAWLTDNTNHCETAWNVCSPLCTKARIWHTKDGVWVRIYSVWTCGLYERWTPKSQRLPVPSTRSHYSY